MTDFVARKMSHANNGVFEPEFRLVLVSFYLVFGAMGGGAGLLDGAGAVELAMVTSGESMEAMLRADMEVFQVSVAVKMRIGRELER